MSERGGRADADRPATLDRLLLAAGVLGGLLWATIPVLAAVTFYRVEVGVAGLGELAGLGSLILLAPVAVVGLLAGTVGLRRWCRDSVGPLARAGTAAMVVGILLLLPGSVVPSGTWPPSLERLVPPVFFAGLVVLAAGSLTFGLGVRRPGALPGWLAAGVATAMPAGVAVGAVAAVAGGGTLALVLGLMVPYGVAWMALGGYLARSGR